MGGGVTVSLVDSQIFADGLGSAGILAQSTGTESGQIQISIDQNSQVRGGTPDGGGLPPSERDSAAIRLLGGTGNRIDNAGQILGANGGIAILADTPSSNTSITNTGRITGDIMFSGGSGGLLDNRSGGMVDAPTAIALGDGGTLHNAGSLLVGGDGRIGRTTLEGDLVQSATGRLVVETSHSTGTADLLDVQGNARLGRHGGGASGDARQPRRDGAERDGGAGGRSGPRGQPHLSLPLRYAAVRQQPAGAAGGGVQRGGRFAGPQPAAGGGASAAALGQRRDAR